MSSTIALATVLAACLLAPVFCLNDNPNRIAGMSIQQKEDALYIHNHLRKNVVPPAASMRKLEWDDGLAQVAQQTADLCVFSHNYNANYSGYGENLYRGRRSNYTEIVTLYYLEREMYKFETAQCDLNGPYGHLGSCNHYTQLVTSDVERFGCGIQSCWLDDHGTTVYLAVCEYNKGYSNPPYKERSPAESPCDRCGPNGYAACDGQLCLPGGAGWECNQNMKLCLNCGTYVNYYDMYCYCECPSNYQGSYCENTFGSAGDDGTCDPCQKDKFSCMNGGSTSVSGSSCSCQCPAGFSGKFCQFDDSEEARTLRLYLGGEMRSSSYYPVPQAWWEQVESQVIAEMQNALSCSSSAAVQVSNNYPAPTIDGSLAIGLKADCGGSEVSKNDLIAAYNSAQSSINNVLAGLGLSVVRTD